MGSATLLNLLLAIAVGIAIAITTVDCNSEGVVLYAWKKKLVDPYNTLQSWDPTLVNPCTWLHITCNLDNSVTRVKTLTTKAAFGAVEKAAFSQSKENLTLAESCFGTCEKQSQMHNWDLANAGLSGPIVPQLGHLANLQYLELSNNSFSGMIPSAIGNLTKLRSLDLDHNQLTGSIPSSISNLHFLWFMRMNSNKLSGSIPMGIINLVRTGNLMILNVSDNSLTGTVHTTDPEGLAITTIIQDPKAPTN